MLPCGRRAIFQYFAVKTQMPENNDFTVNPHRHLASRGVYFRGPLGESTVPAVKVEASLPSMKADPKFDGRHGTFDRLDPNV